MSAVMHYFLCPIHGSVQVRLDDGLRYEDPERCFLLVGDRGQQCGQPLTHNVAVDSRD
jgi:hypothetical protein